MPLSLDQVRHVASLARLALKPEEEARYASQLSAILEAVQALEGVETSEVEPTSHATLAASLLREDVQVTSLSPEQVLANAPAQSGTSFAVPRILE